MEMGKLENGKAAHYNFSISDLIKQSWEGIKGYKATFWGAFGFVMLAMFLCTIVVVIIDTIGTNLLHMEETPLSIIDEIVFLIVSLPLVVGVIMLAIKRSAMLPVEARQVFKYYNRIGQIILVYVTQLVILCVLGFIAGVASAFASSTSSGLLACLCLLISVIAGLASLYLLVGYIFAFALKIDKNLSAWQSLEVSRKAVSQHWFKVFFSLVAVYFIVVISAIPLGIGLIWTVPLANLYHGVLYRTMFGVEIAAS